VFGVHGCLEAVVTEYASQRIIVGVHRSAASLAALRWAAAEARLRRVPLHVVHAWEPAVHRASYAILGDRAASGQEWLRAQGVLAAVMRGVYGSEVPPGITAELAEGTLLPSAGAVLGGTRYCDWPGRTSPGGSPLLHQLDRYVELELAGAPADELVPGLRAHLVGCPACAEEHESLRALLELESVS